MNILIKLMSIVSLVIAPTLADLFETKNNSETGAANEKNERSISVNQQNLNPNTVLLR